MTKHEMSAEEFRTLGAKGGKRKAETPKEKEQLEAYLARVASTMGKDWVFQTELVFHPTRRWRFDYAWPELMIAVEYDGIMKRTVGHNSLRGILRDAEKINEAQRLGWRVFRANAKNVEDGSFYVLIENVLNEECGRPHAPGQPLQRALM